MFTACNEIMLNHEDGDITIEHAILALDAQTSGHINFLSSVGPSYCGGKMSGKQILVSHEAHRILAQKFPKAAFLPCSYFRPIVLGNLQVELIPSGHSPGSSFLRVEKKNDSLLYAAHWSKRTSSTLRRAAFRQAETLLLKLQSDLQLCSQRPCVVNSIALASFAQNYCERASVWCWSPMHAVQLTISWACSQNKEFRSLRTNTFRPFSKQKTKTQIFRLPPHRLKMQRSISRAAKVPAGTMEPAPCGSKILPNNLASFWSQKTICWHAGRELFLKVFGYGQVCRITSLPANARGLPT